MSSPNPQHPTVSQTLPTTPQSSLSFLDTLFNHLNSSIEESRNHGKEAYSLETQTLFGIHIGIALLLITFSVDPAPFKKLGLRDDVNEWRHPIQDLRNELHTAERLLHVLKTSLKSRSNRNADPVSVRVVQNTSGSGLRQGDEQAELAKFPGLPFVNGFETNGTATSADEKENVRIENGNVVDTPNMVDEENSATVNDDPPAYGADFEHRNDPRDPKDNATTRNDGNQPNLLNAAINQSAHQIPEGCVIDTVDLSPVMIDLNTHEVALEPALASMGIEGSPLPPCMDIEAIREQLDAEKEVFSPRAPVSLLDDTGMEEFNFCNPDEAMRDRIDQSEVVDQILGDIDELLNDDNSLRGDTDHQVLPNQPFIADGHPEIQGNGGNMDEVDSERTVSCCVAEMPPVAGGKARMREKDGNEGDADSERTLSCCVAGSLIDGGKGARRPIFTDVREEDKIWSFAAENSTSLKRRKTTAKGRS